MWHNQGVEGEGNRSGGSGANRRPPRPLDQERLRELALHYVGRFATTRAKLATYLSRKLRERGWAGDNPPDVAELVQRLAELGYVDDRAFGIAKAGSLTARGFGKRRVRQALAMAGVTEDDATDANEIADERASDAALRFASRRRIGPFAAEPHDPVQREKALAAMIRAGHDFSIARLIVDAKPGNPPEL